MRAIVAGSTPLALRMFSTSSAQLTLCGNGMPWEIIVDSRDTTGLPSPSALETDFEIFSSFSSSLLLDISNYSLVAEKYAR